MIKRKWKVSLNLVILLIGFVCVLGACSSSNEDKAKRAVKDYLKENLDNVILLVFILLYTNKIAVIAPCKRNRIETKSVF